MHNVIIYTLVSLTSVIQSPSLVLVLKTEPLVSARGTKMDSRARLNRDGGQYAQLLFTEYVWVQKWVLLEART